MAANRVAMTRQSFEKGRPGSVRMVVMHSTAGRYPGDYNWLLRGGGVVNGQDRPVSVHYYIDKQGVVSQMVDDNDTAWHAGDSAWDVDGKRIRYCNSISVGIELENNNTGREPFPEAQYNAALQLTRELVARYNVPRRQLVRHLDISPGRKTDPAGFPWARFVSEVYDASGAGAPPANPSLPVPQQEKLPPDTQLRQLLIDLAYRAAGGGAPPGWQLLKETVTRNTGMPVAVLTSPPQSDADDEANATRHLMLPGLPPLIVETYARDLYYTVVGPDGGMSQLLRLSESGPGPVRDGLLEAMFRNADPAKGYQSGWAFHQQYVASPTQIGSPIGPNHRVAGRTSDGKEYACQHFALDTLCSPTDDWSRLIRLSDLTRDMYNGDPHTPVEKELRKLLLDDLYQTRTGRAFDPTALFCRFAIANNLGAPTAKAEVQTLEGRKFVAMPYALDVLYCRIPDDGNWQNVTVGVLGDDDAAGPVSEAGLMRLSQLLTVDAIDKDAQAQTEGAPDHLGDDDDIDDITSPLTYSHGVLGEELETPTVIDLTVRDSLTGSDRGGATISHVEVVPTSGTLANDLAAATQADATTTWHYYVATDGTIYRLMGDSQAARGAATDALVVAVEGAARSEPAPDSAQAHALAWLLNAVQP